jgi:heme exporter protein CcmD
VTHAGYVFAAYLTTFGVLAVYALWVLARGRRLSAQVPEDRRRWS